MIKKLTVRYWISAGILLLFCIVMAVFPLWKYGPSAVRGLQGLPVRLAGEEPMSNIYGIAALGLFFLLLSVAVVIRMLTNSVGKRVKRYLSAHPETALQQLDSDFGAAEEVGNVWIGRGWSYNYDLDCVVVDNSRIAWVYSETEQSRLNTYYYLCLGLADGDVKRIKVSKKKLPRMQEIYAGYPHILVGNNPEYGYQFRNDREAFLEIKYKGNAE